MNIDGLSGSLSKGKTGTREMVVPTSDPILTRSENVIQSSLLENFWLVAADMGYGHQRAIYPLKALSRSAGIINANLSIKATQREIRLWRNMLSTYEFMSRAGKLPLIGRTITRVLDGMLYIPKFYPLKDRSKPTLQVKYLRGKIKQGLCKGVAKQITSPELPLITSYFASAISADLALHEKVYCIICDTDLSRVWAAEDAYRSRIIYFVPGTIAAQRLLSYGVADKNILITGFPLPLSLLGKRNLDTLKYNLSRRLRNLDPSGSFYNLYKYSVDAFLSSVDFESPEADHKHKCVTITYAVDGAGAQKEIGKTLARSLSWKMEKNEVKLNLVAGTRIDVRDYFLEVKNEFAAKSNNLKVIWAGETEMYFDLFNHCLRTTDILWTKPSELSFYCALGIPIITTPAIGPQEKCNRRWLREIGAGFKQRDPEYADQWIDDLLQKGSLAEAAWLGFLKGRKYGTFNILDFLERGSFNVSNNPLKR